MGIRFRKSIKIAPGISMNIGKKSVGLSAGIRGFRYSANSSGRRRVTSSIPGTGLSYSTSTSAKGKKGAAAQKKRELEAKRKQQAKLAEQEYHALQAEEYENKIDRMLSLHKEADDPVQWEDMVHSSSPAAIYKEKAVRTYKEFKPSLFNKLLSNGDAKREKLRLAIADAEKKDESIYKDWLETVDFAKRIIEGDLDAYVEAIEIMRPLDDIIEFGSGFECIAIDSDNMVVEFDVHSDTIVPKEQLSLTKTGKLSVKAMPKGKYYDYQQDYVCSCILRIARDLFALLPLQTIVINANDTIRDSSTGHLKTICILSVSIEKGRLNTLNFEHIDCSDSMANFPHHMAFKKWSGFHEVSKLKE
ncbi:DUF4236 domain-containing protein [Bacillus sp. 1P06AnD]|uniref:DUF4236 domain-containing protein n=1 Tax=Bacillus sp. 1P06AnD TaxID=3132208 RepID=UPI0039A28A43